MTGGNHSIQVVPAGRGLAWLAGALILFRRQPARLLLIGLVLQFLMGFSQAGVLALLLILLIPAFTAGMMQIMLVVEQGARPPLPLLFSAFSSSGRLLRLMVLGALMLAGGILAVMFVLSGSLAELDPALLTRLEAGDVSALDSIDPGLVQRLMFALLAGLLVSASISYFAVPLVWFMDLPLGLAIKQGLLGMIRNWRPFLVLGLLMGVLAMPVGIMIVVLFAASATGSAISTIFTIFMMLVVVVYQLILFGAQYVSFREVFGSSLPVGESETDDSQLVA
jgi:hypothetical protein